MMLQTGNICVDADELKEFSEWILRIGDGVDEQDNDVEIDIEIPTYLLIHTKENNTIASIVNNVYPESQPQQT